MVLPVLQSRCSFSADTVLCQCNPNDIPGTWLIIIISHLLN